MIEASLNGIAFGMLLFLVASGLTVIFGLMRVINLTHGALYMLGAYLGVAVQQETESFWLALGAALLAGLGLALVIDRVFRRGLYGDELTQVLLTLGLALVITDTIEGLAGGNPRSITEPGFLSGAATLPGDTTFPNYRLALIAFGALVAIVVGLVWQRTRLGALLRAGVDDARTLEALGVNIRRIFSISFAVGGALAAVAGVIGGAFIGVYVNVSFDVLLYSLVIVVIGGLGSLRGALAGSLLVGLADSLGKSYVPEASYFLVFAPAILVLAVRPEGLFGSQA